MVVKVKKNDISWFELPIMFLRYANLWNHICFHFRFEKIKKKMKKKISHFNGENFTKLDRSLNWTYLKFKELNWMKVNLKNWNEFMWNLKGGLYNFALKKKKN